MTCCLSPPRAVLNHVPMHSDVSTSGGWRVDVLGDGFQ